jgi:hypothetical protein
MKLLLATALAALALPAGAGATAPPDPAGTINCDDATSSTQTCVYWCPTNPGGGGGYYPCKVNNLPKKP